jgi:hypothetical protein
MGLAPITKTPANAGCTGICGGLSACAAAFRIAAIRLRAAAFKVTAIRIRLRAGGLGNSPLPRTARFRLNGAARLGALSSLQLLPGVFEGDNAVVDRHFACGVRVLGEVSRPQKLEPGADRSLGYGRLAQRAF